MPKTRELTKIERFYVENNSDKTDAQLASIMPGIGPKTVAKFRDTLPQKTDEKTDTKSTTTIETQEERVNRLRSMNAGDLMGRHEENGVVVMTEAASEVSDANRTHRMTESEYKRQNHNRIHTIDPKKSARQT